MENPTLPTNWLAPLSNANHDGTTQQIDDDVGNFETENQVFLQKTCFITEVVLVTKIKGYIIVKW